MERAQAARAHPFPFGRKRKQKGPFCTARRQRKDRDTLKTVRRTFPNSTPHGGSNRKPFRFPAARGNSLTSHAPSLAQCCLGLSLPDCGAMAFQVTKGCRNLALPAADCALSSFLQAEAAPAESDCVAREGISSRSVETKRLQTHRLTAVQTRSLFVSPLREEIPSRATQLVERYAASAFRQRLR